MAPITLQPMNRPRDRKRVLALIPTQVGTAREVLRGVGMVSRQRGWVMHHEPHYPPRRSMVRLWGAADGVVTILGACEPVRRCCERGRTPVALATSYSAGDWPLFRVDNAAAGRVATEHLAESGLKTIGFYRDRDEPYLVQREAACRSAASARGIGFTRCTRAGGLDAWLGALERPAGIVGGEDRLAIDVIQACDRLGLRVPLDVAVVGVEDDELVCRLVEPELTSVHLGSRAAGEAAAEALAAMMDGARIEPGPHVVGGAYLVERRSSGMPACDHPQVQQAWHFARSHACERVGVDDVADHVGLGAHRLRELFVEHLGQTVRDTLVQARINEAKRLLRTTDRSITEISGRCGFTTPATFSAAFRREVGRSPRAYRQRASDAG